MSFLVDTNVLSELRKGARCDPGVRAWFDSVDNDDVHLSVLTLGEIRRGIESIRRRDLEAAGHLDAWLAELTRTHADRILRIDLPVAEEWGRLNVPDALPVIDGLLAATSRVRDLTLVTRNLVDVQRTGVRCLNPFTGT